MSKINERDLSGTRLDVGQVKHVSYSAGDPMRRRSIARQLFCRGPSYHEFLPTPKSGQFLAKPLPVSFERASGANVRREPFLANNFASSFQEKAEELEEVVNPLWFRGIGLV